MSSKNHAEFLREKLEYYLHVMKYVVFGLFLCLNSLFLSAQPHELIQLRMDGIAQWAYVDGDEFDEEKIDDERWRRSYPWGRNLSGHLLHYYADENVYQKGGRLILEAKEQDTIAKSHHWMKPDEKLGDGVTPNQRAFKYTSGMVFSEKKYYQGYFEASVKMTKGRGYFPAFWIYGSLPNEEIDIMEAKGERPNSFHVDMHCPSGCKDYKKFLWWRTKSYGDWVDTENDLTETFNLYAGEWTTGEILFYWNDQVVHQWAGHLKHPANIILNLAINGREGPSDFDGAVDDSTPFPQTFEADYVRVYERIDEGWEEKEKQKLGRKGIKKKKGRKKAAKEVRATARIFIENGIIRIESPSAEFSFSLLSKDGTNKVPIEKDQDGQCRYNLGEAALADYWLLSQADGFSARTDLSRE